MLEHFCPLACVFSNFGRSSFAQKRGVVSAVMVAHVSLLGGCAGYDEEMWLDPYLGGRVAMSISVREELVQGSTGTSATCVRKVFAVTSSECVT